MPCQRLRHGCLSCRTPHFWLQRSFIANFQSRDSTLSGRPARRSSMDFDDDYQLPIKSIAAKPVALDKLAAAWMIDFRPASAALADDKGHRKTCLLNNCLRCSYVLNGPRLAKLTPMLHDASPMQLSKIPADKLQAARSCWLSSAMVDGQWGHHCV